MRKKILLVVLIFLCGLYIGRMSVPDMSAIVDEMEMMQQEIIQERLVVENLSEALWSLREAIE